MLIHIATKNCYWEHSFTFLPSFLPYVCRNFTDVQISIWRQRMCALVYREINVITRQFLKRRSLSAVKGLGKLNFITEVGIVYLQKSWTKWDRY